MHLKNQVEWALHCCFLMAALPEGAYLSAKALSTFYNIPKEYLSKALQALSAADLVDATLGPKGGYRLAKSPDDISFLDIVDAVEGQKSTFNCMEIRRNNPCIDNEVDLNKPCLIAHVMWQADEAWRKSLKSYSLGTLMNTLAQEGRADLYHKSLEWLVESR